MAASPDLLILFRFAANIRNPPFCWKTPLCADWPKNLEPRFRSGNFVKPCLQSGASWEDVSTAVSAECGRGPTKMWLLDGIRSSWAARAGPCRTRRRLHVAQHLHQPLLCPVRPVLRLRNRSLEERAFFPEDRVSNRPICRATAPAHASSNRSPGDKGVRKAAPQRRWHNTAFPNGGGGASHSQGLSAEVGADLSADMITGVSPCISAEIGMEAATITET